MADAVLVELQARRAERVRLDDVAADPEVAGVDVLDEVGPRQREEVVRPLLAAELRGLELVALDLSPSRRRRRGCGGRWLLGRSMGVLEMAGRASGAGRRGEIGPPCASIERARELRAGRRTGARRQRRSGGAGASPARPLPRRSLSATIEACSTRRATGSPRTAGACSARSVRGRAASGRGRPASLHPPEPGRPPRDRWLRPLDRLRGRPDREEAARALPAGLDRAVVRHGGVLPRVLLLPELGHLRRATTSARPTIASPPSASWRSRPRARRAGRRLHVQRPDHLGGVRHRRREGGARGRPLHGVRDERLRGARRARRHLSPHGRDERGPEGVHRGLLRPRRSRTSPRCSPRSSGSRRRRTSGSR